MDENVRELLRRPIELRNIEFKESQPWAELKLKIVKACLALSNIQDGGFLIVGVAETKGRFESIGLTPEHEATYEPDKVTEYVNRFADPNIPLRVQFVEFSGKRFLAIQVPEFLDVPVICKRSYDKELRHGAIYVRSTRKPESAEISSQVDMRHLINLAVNKGLKKFVATARAAGLSLDVRDESERVDSFGSQLPQLAQLDPELTRQPHWLTVIHPAHRESLSLDECWDRVARSQVSLRVQPFPFVQEETRRQGRDWVGCDDRSDSSTDSWRACPSGLFVHAGTLRDAMTGSSDAPPSQARTLSVVGAIFAVTERFEFASRLALDAGWADSVRVSMSLVGINEMRLEFSDRYRGLDNGQRCRVETISRTWSIPAEALHSSVDRLARRACEDIFAHFDEFSPPGRLLADVQEELRSLRG